jgi:glutaredoxin-related protein
MHFPFDLVLEDNQEIKQLLARLTHHSTFPNILVNGRSIGGSETLAQLYSEKKLGPLFLKAGAKPKQN